MHSDLFQRFIHHNLSGIYKSKQRDGTFKKKDVNYMNYILILGWISLFCGLLCWLYCMSRIIRMIFAKLVYQLNVSDQVGCLKIEERGGYALWEEGPVLKQSTFTRYSPILTNTDTQQIVTWSPSMGRVTKASFTRASVLSCFCYLEKGNYCLEVVQGAAINPIEKKIVEKILEPNNIGQAEDHQYVLQIRKGLTGKQRLFTIIGLFVGMYFVVRGLFTILHLLYGVQLEGSFA